MQRVLMFDDDARLGHGGLALLRRARERERGGERGDGRGAGHRYLGTAQ